MGKKVFEWQVNSHRSYASCLWIADLQSLFLGYDWSVRRMGIFHVRLSESSVVYEVQNYYYARYNVVVLTFAAALRHSDIVGFSLVHAFLHSAMPSLERNLWSKRIKDLGRHHLLFGERILIKISNKLVQSCAKQKLHTDEPRGVRFGNLERTGIRSLENPNQLDMPHLG